MYWNDPKYLSLRDFWAHYFFFDMKSWKSYLDFYYLSFFSVITLLTTRFYFLLILLGFYCIHIYSSWTLYFIFFNVVLSLTFKASSENYSTYINNKYGPATIKKIGWDGPPNPGGPLEKTVVVPLMVMWLPLLLLQIIQNLIFSLVC